MSQPCIIVTDDDPIFRELMDEVLREEGFSNVHSVDSARAYATIAQYRPDLVLLDVHRGQSAAGGALLQRIRHDSATPDVPVIVCSTDPNFAERNPGWFDGQPNQFLPKPFNLNALTQMLRSTLRLSQLALPAR